MVEKYIESSASKQTSGLLTFCLRLGVPFELCFKLCRSHAQACINYSAHTRVAASSSYFENHSTLLASGDMLFELRSVDSLITLEFE